MISKLSPGEASEARGGTTEADPYVTAADDGMEIRRIESLAQYQACRDLQARVWGAGDFVDVSPLVLITAQDSGGMVLGAFDRHRLVGFVCSFVGLTGDGEVRHCSQLLAVDPEAQHSGIGYRLKVAQRRIALSQGIELVTWTFDPLASVNAHFNLCKLGCTAARYVEDFYGEPVGGLNGGLATDRLVAEWRLRAAGTEARMAGVWLQDAPRGVAVNQLVLDRDGLPVNTRVRLDLSDPELLVEIPDDLTRLKERDMERARTWRREVRAMLTAYLRRGYRAVGFYRRRARARGAAAYQLVREVVGDAE